MNFTLFHFNERAKISEEIVDMIPIEEFRVTPMKIKDEFVAISCTAFSCAPMFHNFRLPRGPKMTGHGVSSR